MNAPITVSIPVGPNPSNVRWLGECLNSLWHQTLKPAEVLLIDDGANLGLMPGLSIWKSPWRLGVTHAFNFGVALAQNNLVVMLGSDDWLHPEAIERAYVAWNDIRDPMGYYGFIVKYADGRIQYDPCNGAMVTKDLWQATGGFPIEAAIGACDTWLISLLMISNGRFGNLHQIGPEPYYFYRNHSDTDTVTRPISMDVVAIARDAWLKAKMKELE
jgi:hypothetical protein